MFYKSCKLLVATAIFKFGIYDIAEFLTTPETYLENSRANIGANVLLLVTNMGCFSHMARLASPKSWQSLQSKLRCRDIVSYSYALNVLPVYMSRDDPVTQVAVILLTLTSYFYHQDYKRSLLTNTEVYAPYFASDLMMIHVRSVIPLRRLAGFNYATCIISNTAFFISRMHLMKRGAIAETNYITGLSKLADLALATATTVSAVALAKLAIVMATTSMILIVEPFHDYSYVAAHACFWAISYYEYLQ